MLSIDAGGVDGQVKFDRLVSALRELEVLLDRYGEPGWVRWIATSRVLIEHGDGYGLLHLLKGYGGMGSFNDVAIYSRDGDAARRAEYEAAHARLHDLASLAYALAQDLRRSADV